MRAFAAGSARNAVLSGLFASVAGMALVPTAAAAQDTGDIDARLAAMEARLNALADENAALREQVEGLESDQHAQPPRLPLLRRVGPPPTPAPSPTPAAAP